MRNLRCNSAISRRNGDGGYFPQIAQKPAKQAEPENFRRSKTKRYVSIVDWFLFCLSYAAAFSWATEKVKTRKKTFGFCFWRPDKWLVTKFAIADFLVVSAVILFHTVASRLKKNASDLI